MSELYRELCNLFIRPARQQYSLYDLGSPIIQSLGRRKDFDLKNSRGLMLKSYQGCVVYLHSLNGSRLESAHLAKKFLNLGIGFANLDMSGSGQSQGQYVSLGYHQRLDAKALIDYLHMNYGIKLFGIWGRSMGAVTALNAAFAMQMNSQSIIACIILDSPYYSLMELSLEIADKKVGLPSLLIKAGMLLIRSSIQDKVKFRVQDLQMKEIVKHLKVPILILASKQDELINWHHSQRIYSQYFSKDKQLLFIKGSHASIRDQQVISKIISYLQKNLKIGQNRLKRMNSAISDYRHQYMVSVKSSQHLIKQSVSPTRRTVRSITPSYIISRASIKISEKHNNQQNNRYKTQKTIHQQQQNFQVSTSTIDIQSNSHKNIISQKLFKMKPKNADYKKYSQQKYNIQQQSPRRAKVTNTRVLQLKKKPNISSALYQNKLNHNPYLTNPNLVRSINEQNN